MLHEMRTQGAKVHEHEIAVVLRAIERGARDVRQQMEGAVDAYLSLMGRLLHINRMAQSRAQAPTNRPGSSIVLP